MAHHQNTCESEIIETPQKQIEKSRRYLKQARDAIANSAEGIDRRSARDLLINLFLGYVGYENISPTDQGTQRIGRIVQAIFDYNFGESGPLLGLVDEEIEMVERWSETDHQDGVINNVPAVLAGLIRIRTALSPKETQQET